MTKAERTTVQGLINRMTELDEVRDETLVALQDLNQTYGDGHRWCSWDACLDGLAGVLDKDDANFKRALYQYKRFVEASAKLDLIRDFGGELAKIGFWK